MPRHAHHAPEVGVLLVAPQHLPLAVARKDQHRAAVGAHVAQRRHVVHQRLRIGQPQFTAPFEMRHHLPAVGDQRHKRRIGVDAVRLQPALVQPDHRREVTPCRMPGHEHPPGVAAVRGDVLHHPCRRCGRIVDTVGDLHRRREAVLHAHHGQALVFQCLGDLAPSARQPAAVVPHHGRKAGFPDRIINIQPAHRVDVPIARGIAVGNILHRLIGAFLRHRPRAAHGQHEEQSNQSFHPREFIRVIKIGKIRQKALYLQEIYSAQTGRQPASGPHCLSGNRNRKKTPAP